MSIFKRLGAKKSHIKKSDALEPNDAPSKPAGLATIGTSNAPNTIVPDVSENRDKPFDVAALDEIDQRLRANLVQYEATSDSEVGHDTVSTPTETQCEEKASPQSNTATPIKTALEGISGEGIGGIKFVNDDLANFKAPEISAQLPLNTAHINATPRPSPRRVTEPVSRMSDRPQKDLGSIRLDIAKISSDIESGEALYRRAQSRVEGLAGFIEDAEISFSRLDRLEPENRRLKARNLTLSKDNESLQSDMTILRTKYEEGERRLAAAHSALENTQAQLTHVSADLQTRNSDIKIMTTRNIDLEVQFGREKNAYVIETRENVTLRDKIMSLTDALEDASNEKMAFAKMVESLKVDYDDLRNVKEAGEAEVNTLRHALQNAEKQNAEMKSQLMAVHGDIKAFKTDYEFNVISRDDRIFALEAQIDDLTKQLKIKDEIVTSAAQDVAQLRTARTGHELERERLEKTIQNQNFQLDNAQQQLSKSKQNMDELDHRFRNAASALAMTQQRRQNQAPAQTPDIQPRHDEATPQTLTSKRNIITDTEIEDRIMDYKLGLRNSIM